MKASQDTKGYVTAFLVVVMTELFITIISVVQSARVSDLITENFHVFNINECLEMVQLKFRCCGFRSFTEWLEQLNTTLADEQVHFQYSKLNLYNSYNISTRKHPPFGIFPESCVCNDSAFLGCATINYTFSPKYLNQANYSVFNQTKETSTHFDYPFSDSVTVYSTACFSPIVKELKTFNLGAGLTSLFAFIIRLLVFGFEFYIIHNVEGATTVADVYRPSNQNGSIRCEGHTGQITNVNLNAFSVHTNNLQPLTVATGSQNVDSKSITTEDDVLPQKIDNIDDPISSSNVIFVKQSQAIDIIF